MGKSVKYEYDANKKQIVVLFKNGFRVEDESSFCRTHYFADTDNRIITTMFKDQLLKLFNVDSVKELKEKIDNNIKLLFKPGEGEIEFDDNTKTVIVYTTTFKEEVVKPAEKTKKLKKNIEKLSNNEKISSYEYTNLITAIAEGIDSVELNEKDRNTIAKIIPKLIKDGNVKISLKDVTDINKDRLRDIVTIGRDLLAKKIGVEKKIGLERKYIGKEYVYMVHIYYLVL